MQSYHSPQSTSSLTLKLMLPPQRHSFSDALNQFLIGGRYINQEMATIFIHSAERQNHPCKLTESSSRITLEWGYLSSIDQYFDEGAFVKNHGSQLPPAYNSQTQQLLKERPQGTNKETRFGSQKRSIFHNFQKHVITILRNIVSFRKNKKSQGSNRLVACAIWKAFRKATVFSKLTLQMIFGTNPLQSPETSLQKIATRFKQFRPIAKKYSAGRILEAQALIRSEVALQMKSMGKGRLKSSCKVGNFQAFYRYLESLMQEIQAGPMARRMSKTQKILFMEKLTKDDASL